MPGKNNPFTALVERMSPPGIPLNARQPGKEDDGFGGGAGCCPRVRYAYAEWRLSP
jgi:hypothetical protein